MKRKNDGLMRVENLINNDRLKNGRGFVELLTADCDRVLKDYFEYKGYPKVEISGRGNAFSVSVTVLAEGVRAFSVLPEENAL